MSSKTAKLIVFLGVLEMFLGAKFMLAPDPEELHVAKFHEDPSSRALCFTYILTLGFQRLTYATGDRQFWPWVFLVLTHVVEAWMWWTIGIQAGYLDGYESVKDFVVAVATANHAEKFSKILLIVPVLIFVFLVTGPESSSTKQKKK